MRRKHLVSMAAHRGAEELSMVLEAQGAALFAGGAESEREAGHADGIAWCIRLLRELARRER